MLLSITKPLNFFLDRLNITLHLADAQDGSLERYARHGWGDVSMLRPDSTRQTKSDAPIKLRCPFADAP